MFDSRMRAVVALFVAAVSILLAQPAPQGHASADGKLPMDPRIVAALQQISRQRIQANIEKLVSFQTRSTLSAQDPASIAAGRGIGAAREWIKSEFERYARDCGGCLEVKTDSFTEAPADRIPKPTEITNVYAALKGTDSESAKRIVLVTGHYDSRNSDNFNGIDAAPGANDDGSGTAVSLECARVLSQLKFPATIIFLTVAGEEQGLYGSQHFAQMAKSAEWNIEAVLNNDIVGGDRNPQQDPNVVRVFSEGVPAAATDADLRQIRSLGGESDSPSREVARYISEVGHTYEAGVKPMLVFRLDRYLRGGDHYSFNQQGYAAVRFTEYREDYNHQHQNIVMPPADSKDPILGDLIRFVDFSYVVQVARLNAATLATLAFAPGEPQKVTVVNKMTENGSTLTWEPPVGAGVAHYEVLWRETTSPNWQYMKPVAAATAGEPVTVTLPVSKDNVIFGVRAVDAKGHRGLVVVP